MGELGPITMGLYKYRLLADVIKWFIAERSQLRAIWFKTVEQLYEAKSVIVILPRHTDLAMKAIVISQIYRLSVSSVIMGPGSDFVAEQRNVSAT